MLNKNCSIPCINCVSSIFRFFSNSRGGNQGGGGEYRPIIHYRDLDAPREPDDFL